VKTSQSDLGSSAEIPINILFLSNMEITPLKKKVLKQENLL